MATGDGVDSSSPKLVFVGGFDERAAFEAREGGFRSHVFAETPDGAQYPLIFYDATRLRQDLEVEARTGNAFIGDPGLIVVTEVTQEKMLLAVQRLFKEGYFSYFKAHRGLESEWKWPFGGQPIPE